MTSVSAVLYDLDGTLLDTSGNITTAVNRTRAELGLGPVSSADAMSCIGDGAVMLVRRAILRDTDASLDEVYPRFAEIYRADPAQGNALYDGVLEALAWFSARGVPQAILTNKPHDVTLEVLAALDLDRWFAGVLGPGAIVDGEPIAPKPDTRGIEHLIALTGADRAGIWMVGDGPQDIAVAQAAGLRSIGILSGFGHSHAIPALDPPPTAIVPTFRAAFEVLGVGVE